MTDKFSVVLTTRRDIEALKPLFIVSDKDTEIIIIDSKYNEETGEALSNIEHNYYKLIYAPPMELPKIKVYENTEIVFKRDLVRCHNTAFGLAENDWIIKVDDSTEFKPDFFDKLRQDIETAWAKKDDVVFRPVKLEEWMDHKKWEQYPILKNMGFTDEQRYIRLGRDGLGGGMFITLDQAVFKKTAILELNGNDERYDIGHGFEDIDLMQRFITLGYNIILDQQLTTFQKTHRVKADPFNFSKLLYDFNYFEILNGKHRAYNPYNLRDIAPQLIEQKHVYQIIKKYPPLPNVSNIPTMGNPNYFSGVYPFDKYFDKQSLITNIDRILNLKNKHLDEDLFIMGNSPDITKNFIEKIRGKTTFAANGFIVMKDVWDYEPTYMVITNQGTFDNHLRNMQPEFEKYEGLSVSDLFLETKCDFVFSDLILKPLFINSLQKKAGYDVDTANRAERRLELCKKHCHIRVLNKEELCYPYMLKTKPTEQDICFDLLKGTFMCGTVITDLMLPLAVWMGFKNIYLKGCSGGAGHFYDISPRHFWDAVHQKEIYEDTYAIFKKLLDEKGINIYNLDDPRNDDYADEMESQKTYNPTRYDGHFWDGPVLHYVLGKTPYIIDYKDVDEVL